MFRALLFSAVLFVTAVSLVSCQYYTQTWTSGIRSAGCDVYGGGIAEDVVGNTYQVMGFPCPITIGSIPLTNNGLDSALVKLDPLANVIWVRALQGPGNQEAVTLTTDSQGNIYVAGFTDTALDGIVMSYGDDGILAKYDSNGNLKFITNQYSAVFAQNQHDIITSIAYSNNFLYFVLSIASCYNCGQLILIKADLSGNLQWYYTAPLVNQNQYAGVARNIVVDPVQQNVYIVGYYTGLWSTTSGNGKQVLGFQSEGQDGFVYAVSTSGFPQWVAAQQTPGGDDTMAVAVDAGGYVYVSGYVQGSLYGQTYSGGNNPFIVKYDHQGNLQWARVFTFTTTMSASSVQVDNLGGVFAQLTDGTNQYLMKLDTNGNEIWQSAMPGTSTINRNYNNYLPGWQQAGYPELFIDSTNTLTLSGVFSGELNLWASANWVPYVVKLQLNNNCTSCAEFDSLLTQLQTLLDVVVD